MSIRKECKKCGNIQVMKNENKELFNYCSFCGGKLKTISTSIEV